MASLRELCDMPIKGDYFLTFDDLLKVICDASVKHKFSFKVLHKDPKRAWYQCTNKACPWLVNAHLNPENENEIIIDKVVSVHSCIGDAQSKRGAATCQEWIQKVIARNMNTKANTPITEIRSIIKRTYSNNFPLIDITELQPLPLSKCHPPLTRVPRGRPKKERYRKEDIHGPRGVAAARQLEEPVGDGDDEVWRPYHCSICGGRGHFLSTYRRPH
jgi:hypothetical protein